MNRRNLIGIGTAAAVVSLAGHTEAASPAPRPAPPAPFIGRPDGTQLFYKDWGRGAPLLFVHSATVSSEIWTYQMTPALRAGHRVVAYDRRGHGRSSVPGTGYDYDTLADDLAGVIETLDLRDVTLVGHSMGCGEIVRYLTRHGAGRVRRIVLLAPTLPFFLKTPDNPMGLDRSFFEGLRALWLRDYADWAWQQTPAFFGPGASDALQRWGFTLGTQTNLHAVIETNIAVTETDFRGELAKISVPTLIVHGTKDASCPLALTGERTARLIAGAKLVVIDGAPHGLLLTHVDRVNEAILGSGHAG